MNISIIFVSFTIILLSNINTHCDWLKDIHQSEYKVIYNNSGVFPTATWDLNIVTEGTN